MATSRNTQEPGRALIWPEGGFQWTPGLREQVPPVRGIAPAVWAPRPDWRTALPEISSSHRGQLLKHHWTNEQFHEVCRTLPQHGADPAHWREAYMQCLTRGPEPWDWVMEAAIASHGLQFALTMWLGCIDELRAEEDWGIRVLRAALSCASGAEHAACLARAGEARGQSLLLDCQISYLFPEQRAWAEEDCLRNMNSFTGRWLSACDLPIETLVARFDKNALVHVWNDRQVALLQLQAHGADALAFLFSCIDHYFGLRGYRDDAKPLLSLLERCHFPEILPLLAARADHPEIMKVLEKFARRWPVATMKCALEEIYQYPNKKSTAALSLSIKRLAAKAPECVDAALAACDPAIRKKFSGLRAQTSEPAEDADDAPDILRNPPWVGGKPIVAALEPLPDEDAAIVWPPEWENAPELDREWRRQNHALVTHRADKRWEDWTPAALLEELRILERAHERVLRGGALEPGDVKPRQGYFDPRAALWPLTFLPPEVALAIWNSLPAAHWSLDPWNLRFLLREHGLALLPKLAESGLRAGQELRICRSGQVAPVMASALESGDRELAQEWLKACPDTAARALIPKLFIKDKKPREHALMALLWLAQNAGEASVGTTAAVYAAREKGRAAATALARLAATPFFSLLGMTDSGAPDFFVPGAFRRPQSKAGGALPDSALSALGQMLAICAWVAEHPGESAQAPFSWLEEVKAACTPESLSEFAWEVFEAWRNSGMPPGGRWAFFALKAFGRDDVALRLASRIRQWETEVKIQRVLYGMEVLEAIGTDVALSCLNGLSHQLKKTWLRERAQGKIAEIARRLGLSADQLADRLVPDLGLDAGGTLRLDFGPRQFSVAFDESLKPFVRDADGKRLKDLPKPNQKDDAAKAQPAVAAYKELKKAARAIDSLQIRRLEQAMCARRRWRAEDFHRFFREHPLMRHLARRLVWGVYDGETGALQDAFLVTEDATLADRTDEPYALPDGARVGIAHRLEMDEALRVACAQVFADYEILQPFRQLGREIYTLTGDEARSRAVTRFNGRKVAPGSLMGLTGRGWRREVGSGGNVTECVKPVGNTTATLRFEDGFFVGDVRGEAQTLTALELADTPAAADALAVSEMLRDVDLLAAV